MSDTGKEDGARSAVERAEDLLADLEERVRPHVARAVGTVAEFLEDVWAEAKHVHRQRSTDE